MRPLRARSGRLTPVILFVLAVASAPPGARAVSFGQPGVAACLARADAPAPAALQGGVASAARVDGDRLLRDVRALAAAEMEGRSTGSAGSRRAQEYILARFRQVGLRPVAGSHQQEFRIGAQLPPGRDEAGRAAANLLGMVPGRTDPGEFVLVSAHYDHLGVRGGRVYPGADDNASGVAALLEIARWVAKDPPARSVLFVAFDAEEEDLGGARHFVANPPVDLRRIRAVVNLDMMGRGDGNTLIVAGPARYPSLKPVVTQAALGRQLTVRFGHDQPGSDDWTYASDHGPFHDAGVPFLYFGVPEHSDYHKPTDTADRIPVRFFVEATELVLDTVQRLARAT